MKNKEITEAQINLWKKKHGDVFLITVEDKKAYIKKPTRQILAHATAVGSSDAFKFNETILNDCWLDGDDEMKFNDDYFLAISGQLDKVIEIKEAEIKKL